jgi:hypothetical protein
MAKCEHDRARQTCSVCSPEQVFRQYQYKAEQRHLTFRLTLGEFTKLIEQSCHYCGEFEIMGVDRVDNRVGYLVSNSVPCCFECNFMKRTMDKHKFVNRAIKIARHQEKLKAKLKTGHPGTAGAVVAPCPALS